MYHVPWGRIVRCSFPIPTVKKKENILIYLFMLCIPDGGTWALNICVYVRLLGRDADTIILCLWCAQRKRLRSILFVLCRKKTLFIAVSCKHPLAYTHTNHFYNGIFPFCFFWCLLNYSSTQQKPLVIISINLDIFKIWFYLCDDDFYCHNFSEQKKTTYSWR